jgi:hypothetical protein
MNWIAALSLALLMVSGAASAQTPVRSSPPTLSCPGDVVVWVNTRSGVYHYPGERYYGTTKYGKFVCEKAARAEGDRPTKNGQ